MKLWSFSSLQEDCNRGLRVGGKASAVSLVTCPHHFPAMEEKGKAQPRWHSWHSPGGKSPEELNAEVPSTHPTHFVSLFFIFTFFSASVVTECQRPSFCVLPCCSMWVGTMLSLCTACAVGCLIHAKLWQQSSVCPRSQSSSRGPYPILLHLCLRRSEAEGIPPAPSTLGAGAPSTLDEQLELT